MVYTKVILVYPCPVIPPVSSRMSRRYFAKRFEHIVEAEYARRKARATEGSTEGGDGVSFGRRLTQVFSFRSVRGDRDREPAEGKEEKKRTGFLTAKKTFRKLRPDMIRRMDDAPKPVGPNGWISEEPVVVPPSRPRSASIMVGELAHEKEKESSNGK